MKSFLKIKCINKRHCKQSQKASKIPRKDVCNTYSKDLFQNLCDLQKLKFDDITDELLIV